MIRKELKERKKMPNINRNGKKLSERILRRKKNEKEAIKKKKKKKVSNTVLKWQKWIKRPNLVTIRLILTSYRALVTCRVLLSFILEDL